MDDEEGSHDVSADAEQDSSFDRWALIGAIALAAVGFAAFYSRHGEPESPIDTDAPESADLLTIRIGGERPAGFVPSEPSRSEPSIPSPHAGDVASDPGPGSPADDRRPFATRTVIVQPGETLGEIVQRELGTVRRVDEVVELNGLADANDIRAGATLLLPTE